MATDGHLGLELGALLAAADSAAPVAAAEVVATALGDALGAHDVTFAIADFSGHALIRLNGDGDGNAATRRQGAETADRVALDGTPQGAALAQQRITVVEEEDGARVYAPVTSRGEAVGVLELRLPNAPGASELADVGAAAHALAYVVIANRRYTDLFEWGQRSLPLSLAAEIQHRLLPGSYTCEAGQFTLAAWLEPAGDVGGDTFDFSLERTMLHVSMSDAMGHTVQASLLATVLVGALRNARRHGASLVDQARLANEALIAHAGEGEYVTAQLARIDLTTQTARIINAGHPPPMRLRGGRAERVALDADPPFGAIAGHVFQVQELPLVPGDRLLFLTDGMLEREAAAADIGELLAAGGDLHPREAIQRLSHAVLAACNGRLRDDATALCLDWHGGPIRDRVTSGGANTAPFDGAS